MPERGELTPTKPSQWLELLDELRALGGVAENVRLGVGPLGRGLFPIDCAKPIELLIPENLLVPVDDIVFKDGALRIAPTSSIGKRERAWFEAFERDFSWGSGGRSDTERRLLDMQSLPETLRRTLSVQFDFGGWFAPYTEDLVAQHFLSSRAMKYNGRRVLIGVAELINHGGFRSYDVSAGVSVRGTFEREILQSYGDHDPWNRFRIWGFACEEPIALSLPLTAQTSFGELVVQRRVDHGVRHDIPPFEQILLPELKLDGLQPTLSFVTLGMRNAPRLPKGVFYKIFRDAGLNGAEEAFDLIMRWNQQHFLNLLEALEGVEGPAARSLRDMARFQMKAMLHCYGSRAL